MFHAVRSWWRGGRGKVTLRLFAFEFLVVVAGVIVAQWLANWVANRGEIARMERARETAREQVAAATFIARGWKRAATCIDRRMNDVMRWAGEGRPIESALLARPSLSNAQVVLPDEQSMLLLARRYPEREARMLRRASRNVDNLSDNVGDIAAAWEGLTLVDPAFGPVAQRDREQARLAAARIKSRLVGIRINAENLIDSAKRIGVAPEAGKLRLIRDCADLWASGKAVPGVVD